jgi:hypothetical protein
MCNCLLASRFRPPILYKILFVQNRKSVGVQVYHNGPELLWTYFTWTLFIVWTENYVLEDGSFSLVR